MCGNSSNGKMDCVIVITMKKDILAENRFTSSTLSISVIDHPQKFMTVVGIFSSFSIFLSMMNVPSGLIFFLLLIWGLKKEWQGQHSWIQTWILKSPAQCALTWSPLDQPVEPEHPDKMQQQPLWIVANGRAPCQSDLQFCWILIGCTAPIIASVAFGWVTLTLLGLSINIVLTLAVWNNIIFKFPHFQTTDSTDIEDNLIAQLMESDVHNWVILNMPHSINWEPLLCFLSHHDDLLDQAQLILNISNDNGHLLPLELNRLGFSKVSKNTFAGLKLHVPSSNNDSNTEENPDSQSTSDQPSTE